MQISLDEFNLTGADSKRKGMTRVWSTLLVIACLFLVNTANAGIMNHPHEPKADTAVLPLATGTFWQLGISRIDDWNDEELAAEVAMVKNAGMDVIIIHYSAIWDVETNKYYTYIPNGGFTTFHNLGSRDPLGAIFAAAEKLDMKIILGDFLVPINIRYDQAEEALEYWLSPKAMKFRFNVIDRYKDSPSFYGYYIANEPNPNNFKSQKDKDRFFNATKSVIAYVKDIHPSLKIIHSIGLYPEWKTDSNGIATPHAPSPAYLESFWGRWINELDQVDIWMMIDGIGTKLASLQTTEIAQAWGSEVVHRAGKTFWVDVENALMGNQFIPFTISELISSLNVARKYADRIVLFEHLSYMTPNNNNPKANKLYSDYLRYEQRY